MRCVACLREGTKKDFLYTEDKKSYCVNPFECNEEHPNSVQNILERGGAVKMYNEPELEETMFERLSIPEEMKDRIVKVTTKPQSIRLSKLDIAYYLLQLQDRAKLSSISEAVRYCVYYTMEHMPAHTIPSDEPTPQDTPSVPFVVNKREGVRIIPKDAPLEIPDIPKSVNVDWSKVPVAEPTPEPEKEDEEEFTF